MPPTRCTVCEHPERDRIDQALREGQALRSIVRNLGVGRTALTNHALAHVTGIGADRRPASKGGRPRKPPTSTLAVAPIVPRDHGEVLAHWGVALAEATDALQAAKLTRDLVRINKAVDSYVAIVDRFAKALKVPGFGNDGATINIDNSTKRLELAVSGLSTEELRRFLTGNDDVPTLTVVNDDTDVPALTVVNDTNVTVDQHVERDGDAA